MGKDVIIACDFPGRKEVFEFLDKFTDEKPFVKIGMELFYAEGPQIVRDIKARGHKIFLDLKLHDIPNTVKKAMAVLSNLDVDMVNVISESMENTVMHYAKNAKDSGLDGVVCSPLEAEKVHSVCGDGFIAVTPGVRFADGDKGDQVRVTTPEGAKKLGSDYIVVGRPVTQADDPVKAYKRCVKEFVGGMENE